jgi:hypothetical protein
MMVQEKFGKTTNFFADYGGLPANTPNRLPKLANESVFRAIDDVQRPLTAAIFAMVATPVIPFKEDGPRFSAHSRTAQSPINACPARHFPPP